MARGASSACASWNLPHSSRPCTASSGTWSSAAPSCISTRSSQRAPTTARPRASTDGCGGESLVDFTLSMSQSRIGVTTDPRSESSLKALNMASFVCFDCARRARNWYAGTTKADLSGCCTSPSQMAWTAPSRTASSIFSARSLARDDVTSRSDMTHSICSTSSGSDLRIAATMPGMLDRLSTWGVCLCCLGILKCTYPAARTRAMQRTPPPCQ
mmetsp:Transcript_21501/g.63466  ORF Transcript_21501/g.63466 Transcript_21501/m.63466 type:complete len:214 (-) Transcript_21501:107-748(-)